MPYVTVCFHLGCIIILILVGNMMKHAFKKHMCYTHVSCDLHFTHFSPPSWRLKFLRRTRIVSVNITGLAPPTKKSVKKNSLFQRWKTATRFGSSQKQLMNNLMIFAFIYLQYTLYTNSIQNQKQLYNFDTFWVWDATSSLLIPVGHYKTQISWEAIHLDAKGTQLGLAAWWKIDNRMVEYHPPPKIIIYGKGGGLSFNTIHISKYSNRLHDNSLDLASAGCITKLCCWCRIKS